MSRKNWGFTLAAIGLIMVLLAALADTIGIGGTPGFGYAQIAALVIGFIVLLVGLYLAFGVAGPVESAGMHPVAAAGAPAASAAVGPAPAAAPAAAPAGAQPATDGQKDDLTRLEGVGPRLQDVLYSAGYTTYTALARATPEAITSAVRASGIKVPFDASSWPEQASLAAQGNWSALEKLQASLTRGRR